MANNKVVLNNGTVLIDLTDSTVTAEDLAEGIIAYDKSGERITGAMVIDSEMSGSSENAVQNRVIKEYVDNTIIDYLRDGVPLEYSRLEYIQSDGSAYVDTGLTLDGDLSFVIDCGGVSGSKIGTGITGHNSTSSENGRQGFLIFNTQSHKIDYYWLGVGYSTMYVDSNIDFASKIRVTQDRYGIKVEQGLYETSVSYNGSDATNTSQIYLLHSENPNHSSYNNGRIYKAVISKDGMAIRKFVPAARKSDGAIGLYDSENKVFYENAGSGAFIPGFYID